MPPCEISGADFLLVAGPFVILASAASFCREIFFRFVPFSQSAAMPVFSVPAALSISHLLSVNRIEKKKKTSRNNVSSRFFYNFRGVVSRTRLIERSAVSIFRQVFGELHKKITGLFFFKESRPTFFTCRSVNGYAMPEITNFSANFFQ